MYNNSKKNSDHPSQTYTRMKQEFFKDLEFDELKHYEETQQKKLNKKDQLEKKSK